MPRRTPRRFRDLPPPPSADSLPTGPPAGVAVSSPTSAGEARLTEIIGDVVARRLGTDSPDPWALPVVVACRRLIADTLGQLPLITLRGRRPLPTQPALTVRPNRDEPRWLTFHRAANQLTRHGHHWLLVTDTDAAGHPAAVRVLDAHDATAVFDPVTGVLDTVWHDGLELVPGLEVIWVPYDVARRADLGGSPLRDCWRTVEYLSALWSMAGSFWEAGFPSLAVQVAHRLAPGQADELKQQLLGAWAGRHEPAVVDNDAKLQTIGASALESQLVESIGAANAEIARAFLMPPSLVNVASGDSLTYSTTEGEFTRWKATGLGSFLMREEAAFTDLTPLGQTCRFDTSELTRSDFQARADAYATALAGAQWLTVDEVRDREGLDPMEVTGSPPPVSSAAVLAGDPP